MSCYKMTFRSRSEAERAIKRNKRMRGLPRPYACRDCGLFHITRAPKRRSDE